MYSQFSELEDLICDRERARVRIITMKTLGCRRQKCSVGWVGEEFDVHSMSGGCCADFCSNSLFFTICPAPELLPVVRPLER